MYLPLDLQQEIYDGLCRGWSSCPCGYCGSSQNFRGTSFLDLGNVGKRVSEREESSIFPDFPNYLWLTMYVPMFFMAMEKP